MTRIPADSDSNPLQSPMHNFKLHFRASCPSHHSERRITVGPCPSLSSPKLFMSARWKARVPRVRTRDVTECASAVRSHHSLGVSRTLTSSRPTTNVKRITTRIAHRKWSQAAGDQQLSNSTARQLDSISVADTSIMYVHWHAGDETTKVGKYSILGT